MRQPCVVLATASYDHTIRFWKAESGRCYRTIQYPDSAKSSNIGEHQARTLMVFSKKTETDNNCKRALTTAGKRTSETVVYGHIARVSTVQCIRLVVELLCLPCDTSTHKFKTKRGKMLLYTSEK
ncbi:hypothetical protein YC2023_061873 [Brassica napus]